MPSSRNPLSLHDPAARPEEGHWGKNTKRSVPPHADLALRRVLVQDCMVQSRLNRKGPNRIVQQLVGPVMARSESFHLQLVFFCDCEV